jgi:hypothetical protein
MNPIYQNSIQVWEKEMEMARQTGRWPRILPEADPVQATRQRIETKPRLALLAALARLFRPAPAPRTACSEC